MIQKYNCMEHERDGTSESLGAGIHAGNWVKVTICGWWATIQHEALQRKVTFCQQFTQFQCCLAHKYLEPALLGSVPGIGRIWGLMINYAITMSLELEHSLWKTMWLWTSFRSIISGTRIIVLPKMILFSPLSYHILGKCCLSLQKQDLTELITLVAEGPRLAFVVPRLPI